MATNKLNLNKIREEIDKEKLSRMSPSQLNENTGKNVSPRDEFLNGLLMARKSGKDTPASTLIKNVENKVAAKHGEVIRHVINETPTQHPTQHPINDNRIDKISADRDEQLFRDLNTKRTETLAESIQNFNGSNNQNTQNPQNPQVNYNGNQYLTTQPQQPQQQLNEAALVENVKGVVNNYLAENLGSVFEEAIKNTVIEMYAVERIKEVLNENRDLIKSVVIETIRDIQDRNKKKSRN